MDVGEEARFHLPKGFKFNPTDQDLILYYLRPKVLGKELPCKIIREDINVYGAEPWTFIPSSIHEAYFFVFRPHRSRAVSSLGRWKTSGSKKVIKDDGKVIGCMNSLVFEFLNKKENTGWIMHEYELPSPMDKANTNGSVWVICRIKRNKQLEKKRTRYNEDVVSNGDEEFPLLSSQGASKKMACDARGWEQERPVEGVRFDPRLSLEQEIMGANNVINEFSFDDLFNGPNDGFMDIPRDVQEESLKQLEMEFRACFQS
ncbi:hypothetical protein J5N97_019912 [Dioscorea zingiberensis]|uniref:NAC domain-containing protein n=1 Tax=Dioscorea zingiberensis TaxID=325984 RepID=A0A9D5CEZ1_9LILI|nr:hypothetical protein J5N97_019912 [Dioscorea zingiberensis]